MSPSNDTYRYARTALRLLGESGSAARADAVRAYCDDEADWLARGRSVDPGAFTAPSGRDQAVARCVRDSPDGLAPTSPRYDAIFDSRVAFPLMAAPLVPMLGVDRALKVTSVLLTALGGVIAWVAAVLGLPLRLRSNGCTSRRGSAPHPSPGTGPDGVRARRRRRPEGQPGTGR